MKNLLFFDEMFTPKFITVIYWLLLIVVVLAGLSTMFSMRNFSGVLAGLFGIVVGALVARIWCELLIVIFKMNEALQEIRETKTE